MLGSSRKGFAWGENLSEPNSVRLSLFRGSSLNSEKTTQKDVLFILIDDLGYNDLGFTNQKILTPNIFAFESRPFFVLPLPFLCAIIMFLIN